MNHNHLKFLCVHFNLGLPKQEPTRVYGGLLHIMWRLDTDKASFAIKQLSSHINLSDTRIIKNYELSESIAARFIEQGIPAICAISKTGQYLFIIEGTGFLVYPWLDAKALQEHAVSEEHALKIAVILAKMHCLNLDEPQITQPEFYLHTNEKIMSLIHKTKILSLKKYQDTILAANQAYQNALKGLKNNLVVSHGDLDQKNVLWDSSNNPILIDWEAACKINPTYDIVNTAFYWSGITSNFNKELFVKMIKAYQNAGGVIKPEHIAAACYGAFSWIGWLVYNIECDCVEQVNQTLATILQLEKVIPEVRCLCREICAK